MKKTRYEIIDSLRGLALVSMILYHGCWDLVFLFEKNWNWYRGTGAYIWQQSICWTFIFLSGFCWPMGRRPMRRGVIVFAGGAVVSLVTCLFMPESRVMFGILTMTGSCMLLMCLFDKVFVRIPALIGLVGGTVLFVLTRNINSGYLGFEGWNFLKLPNSLYQKGIMTFLGFPASGFFSTDYFSLFPWLFLFAAGYFLHRLLAGKNNGMLPGWCEIKGFLPLNFLGRHSLILYMLHQPVIYGALMALSLLGLL